MEQIHDPGQIQKLTDWAKEPTLQQLVADLEMAKPAHDNQMLKIRRWRDLATVTGTASPKKVKGRSSVQPKLIRRQAEWRYSALTEPFLGSNRVFTVKPSSWEDENAAKQSQLVLNWQFRTKMNRVKFIDDYVRSTVDEGTAIVRVGWCRKTVKVSKEVPVYEHYEITDEQQFEQFQAALTMAQENPQAFEETAPDELKEAVSFYEESNQATYAIKVRTEKVMVDKVVENRPTIDLIDPQNFYLDPTCNGDINKALFAIISFETNKAELLKSPGRYKNLDQVNWETATPLTTPDHATKTNENAQFSDILRKKVVAYEYWGYADIKGNGELVPVVVTWIGTTIIRMELNPFPDKKLPFILVPYLPVKREAFGESDAELLEDNQKILGALVRGMIDLMGRSANAQRGTAKGMLDPLNKRKYDAGEDYEFNPGMNPTNHLIEHKFPELPQSALQMVTLQNAEAEALTGVKSFSGGMSGEAYGDVAAGIKGVLDAAAKREMAILRRLAQGMMEIGQKLISMNAAFLSEKETVRITNMDFVQLSPSQQEGAQEASDKTGDMFVTVNREDLAGNFDLEVDISTAEVDNAKAQDLGFILQTLGPNEDPSMRRMILAEICDLKRMPALAHQLRTYQPQPDPLAEQAKQLELKKLELECMELESQIELNRAKAAEAQSKKDKTDLDYVEQETGTKHARELDKQGAQARANQDLVITKALTTPNKPEEKKPDIEAAVGYNEITERRARDNTVLPPAPPVDTFDQTPALEAPILA